MRDVFGEIDPDEIDIIDLVEPDAGAFGELSESDLPTERRERRRWVKPAAIAGAVGIAATAVMVWSPWQSDDTRAFPDGETPQLTLTEQLVLDDPPLSLAAASLGTATDEDFESFPGEGYIFAEPGASVNFNGESSGGWALFFAPESDSEPDPTDFENGTAGTVQGAAAVISAPAEGQIQIDFGPVDGRVFTVVTGGLTRAESLVFAEAVGVDDGVPTLTYGDVLGTMQPVGDIDDFRVATNTVFQAILPFGTTPEVVSVHYGDFDFEGNGGATYSVTSQPVIGSTTLATLRFFFNGKDGRSVHGQPAVVVEAAGAMFGGDPTPSVVAWVEGGRLVVVSGPDNAEATLALAETVRPATDDEWAQVVSAAENQVAPSIPLFPVSDAHTLYQEVDPTSGDTYSFTVELDNSSLVMCVEALTSEGSSGSCEAEPFVGRPVLVATDKSSGRQFVLAVIDRDTSTDGELQIILSDGTVEAFPLVEVDSDLPGPAVATLLPEGHGVVKLLIAGEVVAVL